MAIDIRSLFADILPDPAKEMEEKALTRAGLMSKGMQGPLAGYAATIGYNSAQGAEGMRQGLNRMTGGGLSTASERLNKAAQNIDASTPQGQADLLAIVRRERGPGAAEQLREAFLERNRQQREMELKDLQVQTQQDQVEVSRRNTEVYQQQADLQREQFEETRRRNTIEEQRAQNQVNLLNGQWQVNGEDRIIGMRNGQMVMMDDNGQMVPLRGKLKAANGIEYSNREVIEMQDAAVTATDSMRRGNQAGQLARAIESIRPSTTDLYSERTARRLGLGDVAISTILSEYETLRISASKQNQSAGPQSDKDIALALSPVPEATDWEVMSSWLRGVEKLSILEAERARRELSGLEEKKRRSQIISEWEDFISDPENVQNLLESKGAKFVDEESLIQEAMARANPSQGQPAQPPQRQPASPASFNSPLFRGF